MIQIDFDESTHKYYVQGQEFPSVTTILHKQGFIDDTWFTEEARERGKNVHTATQYLDEGDLDFDSIAPDYVPYLKAYQQFLEDFQPNWKLIEFKVADLLYGYAGTLDRLGLITSLNQWWLTDIKTGAANKATGLQIAGYEHALYHMVDIKQFIELTKIPIKDIRDLKIKRRGLYLKNNGTYKIVKYSDKNDIKVFRGASGCVNWQRANL